MIMECYEVESLLIDYLDVQLHPGDRKALEEHLHSCEACRQTLEEYKILFASIADNTTEQPGPALREKFDIMLQSELNIDSTTSILRDKEEGKIVKMSRRPLLLKIAASIILVTIGVLAGTQLKQGNTNVSSTQMADLKNEVKEMKEALFVNMLNQESASERIKAVSYADDIKDPDNRIINALLATMNEDKNVNVRLAALSSVAKYSDTKYVSDSLIASLKRQTEPIMQIALINILTEKKETKAVGPIRDILMDKNTLQPVKDIAQKGLNLL
jgi:hypothetical protein